MLFQCFDGVEGGGPASKQHYGQRHLFVRLETTPPPPITQTFKKLLHWVLIKH